MTLTEEQVVEHVGGLTVTQLRKWVRIGWVRPAASGKTPRYAAADLARLRLIRDLHEICELDEEALRLVLSLIDQVHGLRHELRALAAAVEAQPEDVRKAIKSAYRDLVGG